MIFSPLQLPLKMIHQFYPAPARLRESKRRIDSWTIYFPNQTAFVFKNHDQSNIIMSPKSDYAVL